MNRKQLATTIAIGLLAASTALAEDSTSLTIYSSATPGAISPEMYIPQPGYARSWHDSYRLPGYATVRHERDVSLTDARTSLKFSDVSAFIDPTTVSFVSLTDPDNTHVLEQNFEFDLVSADKLMERYIDREITAEQAFGDRVDTFTGTLLGTVGGITLRDKDGSVRVLKQVSNVEFPELPGGLITKPTLVWDVLTNKPGEHQVRLTYETKAITWWADYNIIFAEGDNANSGLLSIGAWVSIVNRSGATYPDARLKLIAGDVHRAPAPTPHRGARLKSKSLAFAEADGGFEEKSFFEYHMYTLGRTTTLPDNSTKQLELFPTARGVPCEKVLVYYGADAPYRYYNDPMTDRHIGLGGNKKVDIYLRFTNSKQNNMGMPLPAGRIRVSKLDEADGSLEFIGEDKIDHTPKDETLLVKLGSAFDVVGERKQVDFKVDTSRKWIDETIEIKLRNHKTESIDVIVKENLYRWTNWEIEQNTDHFDKIDARTIHFPVRIGPDSEVTLRYRVHYSW